MPLRGSLRRSAVDIKGGVGVSCATVVGRGSIVSKISLFSWFFALAIFAAASRAAPAPDPLPVIAIRAGHFIDVVAGKSVADQLILVRGKVIEAVGPDVPIP